MLFKHSIHVKNNLRNRRVVSNYASYFHRLFLLAGVVNHSLGAGGAKSSRLLVFFIEIFTEIIVDPCIVVKVTVRDPYVPWPVFLIVTHELFLYNPRAKSSS